MGQPQDERMETLIRDTGCDRDIRALLSRPDDHCRAVDVGFDAFLECHHEQPQLCRFARSFGHAFFCRCPLSLYIRREIGR